jgi:hypothetical protein
MIGASCTGAPIGRPAAIRSVRRASRSATSLWRRLVTSTSSAYVRLAFSIDRIGDTASPAATLAAVLPS